MVWQQKFYKNLHFCNKVSINTLPVRRITENMAQKNIRLFGADVIRLMVIL